MTAPTLLERSWEEREERVYPKLFGDVGKAIFPLGPQTFARLGADNAFDPRWLHEGVFESPPNDRRQSWLYVTSGLSNPWEEDEAPLDVDILSGLGVEFVMETPARAKWAIHISHWLMAIQLLKACERLPGPLLGVLGRVAYQAPIAPNDGCELRNVLLAEPTRFDTSFRLESGHVDLILAVGITDAERAHGTANGSASLTALLIDGGAFPTTRPERASLL